MHPSIINDENFKVLAESDKYILGNLWEDAILHIKKNNEDINLCDFYGDPECGTILEDKDCCLVGGDVLVVWKNEEAIIIESNECKWIHRMRRKNETTIEILTDPWSENSAIWEFDIDNMVLKRKGDFFKYREEPYTEDIKW